jgi:hypothetical protein
MKLRERIRKRLMTSEPAVEDMVNELKQLRASPRDRSDRE